MRILEVTALLAALTCAATTVTHAQPQPPPGVTFVSISPTATDISSQFPPPPPRIFTFFFSGTKGTRYTAIFSVPAEPATVVGVGADIESTSYDTNSKQLSVVFDFDLSVLTTEAGKSFPTNAFFLAIDPGAERAFNPKPRPPGGFRPSGATRTAVDTSECYGPLGGPPSADQKGPPLQAAGTLMSTNLAEWCVVPPNESNPLFGFKLRAPAGEKGFFRKKLSPKLVSLLSTLAGRTLDFSSTAIFNEDFQASKSITPTSDGGLLIDIQINFVKTSTVVTERTDAASGSPFLRASSSVDKTISTTEEEELSLAPTNSRVTSVRATLYGFIDDEATLAGQTVVLSRKIGTKTRKLGTAIIQSDGSYTARLRSAKIFAKGASTSATTISKSATVIATVTTTTTRSSREVTLSNRVRSLRR